ncbi:hypothetical protein POV27_18660 [Aureisphaera galaxeae]|uniref:hypothetical protein n=1 Tax=Aureisphaera galaxeae TaxID=1538023 RepID=UPI00235011FE|nr:hypothetical protein [Aureisphaera galaxeae]MDC8006081.1 hypothetical protein [Aureisphaera galaxeae]
MKQGLVVLIAIFIFASCDSKKTKEATSVTDTKTTTKEKETTIPETIDTIVVYWQTNFDTISKTEAVHIGNDKHQLLLKSYSLNDSAVVRINTGNSPRIYKDIYHNYVTEVILTKDTDTILNTMLTKETFQDSLHIEEFRNYALWGGAEYDFIRSNRLYFKGSFNYPDTDWLIGNRFAIFYRTEKKNQIDSWNYEDIGL